MAVNRVLITALLCCVLGVVAAQADTMLLNETFETVPGAWKQFGDGFSASTKEGHKDKTSITMSTKKSDDVLGARYTVDVPDAMKNSVLLISAWSKASGVKAYTTANSYALYVDVAYIAADGVSWEWKWGLFAGFRQGTHDWEKGQISFTPERAVARVEVHVLFRSHTGTAYFDNIQLMGYTPTADPAHSKIVEELANIHPYIGKHVTLNMQGIDQHQALMKVGGDAVTATSSQADITVAVSDDGDGTYSFSFTPTVEGAIVVTVQIGGVTISNGRMELYIDETEPPIPWVPQVVDKSNVLINGAFTDREAFWSFYGPAKFVKSSQCRSRRSCVQLSPRSADDTAGVQQAVYLEQTEVETVVIGGWAKGIPKPKDETDESKKWFAIYFDVTFTDGTHDWAHLVTFPVSKHKYSRYNYAEVTYVPKLPIKMISFNCYIKAHTGIVYFDDLSVKRYSLSLDPTELSLDQMNTHLTLGSSVTALIEASSAVIRKVESSKLDVVASAVHALGYTTTLPVAKVKTGYQITFSPEVPGLFQIHALLGFNHIAGSRQELIVDYAPGSVLVTNPSFELLDIDVVRGWDLYGNGFTSSSSDAHHNSRLVTMTSTNGNLAMGALQKIVMNQNTIAKLVVTGWSKADGVNGNNPAEYSLYADVQLMDGTYSWGHYAPFSPGTHGWEFKELILDLGDKRIKEVYLYCLFRNHSGTVSFDLVEMKVIIDPVIVDPKKTEVVGEAAHKLVVGTEGSIVVVPKALDGSALSQVNADDVLAVTLEHAETGESIDATVAVTETGDEYSITYTAKTAGVHSLNIMLNGALVADSPYSMVVADVDDDKDNECSLNWKTGVRWGWNFCWWKNRLVGIKASKDDDTDEESSGKKKGKSNGTDARLFEEETAAGWVPIGTGFIVANKVGGCRSDACFKLVSATQAPLESHGAQQLMPVIAEVSTRPFVFSGWSKATNAAGTDPLGYSLSVDVKYEDGTEQIGSSAAFTTGTHDWEYKEVIFYPIKAVKSVTVYCYFKQHAGTVFFDNLDFHSSLQLISATNTVVSGPGIKSAIVGVETQFIVQAKDVRGHSIMDTSAMNITVTNVDPCISSIPKAIPVTITDLSEGRFKASYNPVNAGSYQVNIASGSTHIGGSPFQFAVRDAMQLSMKALVVTKAGDEANLAALKHILQGLSIPFTQFFLGQSLPSLTNGKMHGNFYSIVLTSPAAGGSHSNTLSEYARQFGIRRVVLSSTGAVDGLTSGATGAADFVVAFGKAGTAVANHLKADVELPFKSTTRSVYTVTDTAANAKNVFAAYDAANPNSAVAAFVVSAAAGEELHVFFDLDQSFPSRAFAPALVNWVTKGVYVGLRRVNFNFEVQRFLLSSTLTDSSTYRATSADLDTLSSWQTSVTGELPTGSNLRAEFAVSGSGLPDVNNAAGDALFAAAKLKLQSFNFKSNTFANANLDGVTSITDTAADILANSQIMNTLCASHLSSCSFSGVSTFESSGLSNANVLQAFKDGGIFSAMADASVASNLNQESVFFPLTVATDFHILPRYPTEVKAAVSTEAQLLADYHARHPDRASWTLDEILNAEAEVVVGRILGYDHAAYQFDQANIRSFDYDGAQNSLLSLWVDKVITLLETYNALPVHSVNQDDLQNSYHRKEQMDKCQVEATMSVIDKKIAGVSLKSSSKCEVAVTGLSSLLTLETSSDGIRAETYGPDVTVWTSISGSTGNPVNIVAHDASRTDWPHDMVVLSTASTASTASTGSSSSSSSTSDTDNVATVIAGLSPVSLAFFVAVIMGLGALCCCYLVCSRLPFMNTKNKTQAKFRQSPAPSEAESSYDQSSGRARSVYKRGSMIPLTSPEVKEMQNMSDFGSPSRMQSFMYKLESCNSPLGSPANDVRPSPGSGARTKPRLSETLPAHPFACEADSDEDLVLESDLATMKHITAADDKDDAPECKAIDLMLEGVTEVVEEETV